MLWRILLSSTGVVVFMGLQFATNVRSAKSSPRGILTGCGRAYHWPYTLRRPERVLRHVSCAIVPQRALWVSDCGGRGTAVEPQNVYVLGAGGA